MMRQFFIFVLTLMIFSHKAYCDYAVEFGFTPLQGKVVGLGRINASSQDIKFSSVNHPITSELVPAIGIIVTTSFFSEAQDSAAESINTQPLSSGLFDLLDRLASNSVNVEPGLNAPLIIIEHYFFEKFRAEQFFRYETKTVKTSILKREKIKLVPQLCVQTFKPAAAIINLAYHHGRLEGGQGKILEDYLEKRSPDTRAKLEWEFNKKQLDEGKLTGLYSTLNIDAPFSPQLQQLQTDYPAPENTYISPLSPIAHAIADVGAVLPIGQHVEFPMPPDVGYAIPLDWSFVPSIGETTPMITDIKVTGSDFYLYKYDETTGKLVKKELPKPLNKYEFTPQYGSMDLTIWAVPGNKTPCGWEYKEKGTNRSIRYSLITDGDNSTKPDLTLAEGQGLITKEQVHEPPPSPEASQQSAQKQQEATMEVHSSIADTQLHNAVPKLDLPLSILSSKDVLHTLQPAQSIAY